MFNRIPKRQMTREVTRQVLDAIRQGRISCGECLPSEKQLMDAFGVGRSTVREALGALEAVGIIRSQRGRGHIVVDFGPADALNEEVLSLVLMTDRFQQIHEVRMVLETAIAAMAAERITDEEIQELQEILAEADQAVDDERQLLQSTWRLHEKLAEVSGNEVMTKLMTIIHQMIRGSERRLYMPFVSARSEVELHRTLLESIASRDPERARQTMEEHIRAVEEIVQQSTRKLKGKASN